MRTVQAFRSTVGSVSRPVPRGAWFHAHAHHNHNPNPNQDPEVSSSSFPSTGSDVTVTNAHWDRMGRPRTVAAPMVAQSDLAFRHLCRNHGTELAYTQMIHVSNFLKSETFRRSHLDVFPPTSSTVPSKLTPTSSNECLLPSQRKALGGGSGSRAAASSVMEERGPVIVQLAGHDPSSVAECATMVWERTSGGIDGIDLNLGCPQTIARKGRYGAFLMEEDPDLVCRILRTLRETLPPEVAVSAKIRLPVLMANHNNNNNESKHDENNLQSLLRQRIHQLCVDGGIDLLTVHGRTRHQNKIAVGQCDWDAIAWAVREAERHNVPVIANGGIETYDDVIACRAYTQCAAVMSSEALLENPRLFQPPRQQQSLEDGAYTVSPEWKRQLDLSREYLDWAHQVPPLPGSLGHRDGSFNVVRSHLFKFWYRFLEHPDHHDLRTRLAPSSHGVWTIPQARGLLDELTDRLEQENDHHSQSHNENHNHNDHKYGVTWYRRHREAAGRVHKRSRTTSTTMSTTTKAPLAPTLTVEQRKALVRERIDMLRKQRKEWTRGQSQLPLSSSSTSSSSLWLKFPKEEPTRQNIE